MPRGPQLSPRPWLCWVARQGSTCCRKSRVVYQIRGFQVTNCYIFWERGPESTQGQVRPCFHKLLCQQSHHCEDTLFFIFLYIIVLGGSLVPQACLRFLILLSLLPWCWDEWHVSTTPCMVAHLYCMFPSVLPFPAC